METQYNITAIVPARKGSVRLPGKNLLPLCGLPLISHTIQAIADSELITSQDTIVTTDDPGVFDLLGVSYIRKRPAHLATAEASQVDVCLDAVEWFSEQGHNTDIVILLQPTSPLRTGWDIDNAITQYIHSEKKSLVSVSFVQEHPGDMLDIHGNFSPHKHKNYLYLTGAIYIVDLEYLKQKRVFYVQGETELYFMPKWRSIDIDDEEDFIVAEKIMRGGIQHGR